MCSPRQDQARPVREVREKARARVPCSADGSLHEKLASCSGTWDGFGVAVCGTVSYTIMQHMCSPKPPHCANHTLKIADTGKCGWGHNTLKKNANRNSIVLSVTCTNSIRIWHFTCRKTCLLEEPVPDGLQRVRYGEEGKNQPKFRQQV